MEKIDPDKYYSASHVVRAGWLWMKSVLTFTQYLNTDSGRELFKPIVIKRGAVMRYQIQGSTLLKVLALIEAGELQIDKDEKSN